MSSKLRKDFIRIFLRHWSCLLNLSQRQRLR